MTEGKTPDGKTTGDKTLHAAGSKTLSVKRPDSGVVRQAFSHGRTKTVVVEKKRVAVRPGGAPLKVEPQKPAPEEIKVEVKPAPQPEKPAKPAPVQPKSGGMVLRTLTET